MCFFSFACVVAAPRKQQKMAADGQKESGCQSVALSEWEEFLGSLDANVTWKTRGETLTDVCKAFAQSGLCNKSELMGMTIADLEENPKGAKRSIMLKAFDAVNLKEISNSLPAAGQETALASSIRQAVDGARHAKRFSIWLQR